jgi:hypothetical protein
MWTHQIVGRASLTTASTDDVVQHWRRLGARQRTCTAMLHFRRSPVGRTPQRYGWDRLCASFSTQTVRMRRGRWRTDAVPSKVDVRSYPDSGHQLAALLCPLCANSGRDNLAVWVFGAMGVTRLSAVYGSPLWVISGQTVVGQNLTLSVVTQIATNTGAVGLSAKCHN